jgi:hypothetical protein
VANSASSSVPVVSGRAPCPCGSGRRYKACHGKRSAGIAANPRPFAGRADEADLVALRELVPSATAPLPILGAPDRTVTLGTALPLGAPFMVRDNGEILLGLQAAARSDDVGRDLAQAIEVALVTERGTTIEALPAPDPGPTFADLIGPDALSITVHRGFDWLIANPDEIGEAETAAIAEANEQVVPTDRLESVDAAYWCRIGQRAHLRWAMAQDEDRLLDAFARLHHARSFDVGDGTRFVGAFRALGIVIPVWDLPSDRESAEVEAPARALADRLAEALADTTPLTADQRASRAGIISRQLTIR